MLHNTERPPQESLLAPEHWDGYDIMDDDFFDDKSPLNESLVKLTDKELRQARADACENLAKIAAGNATEVRFNTGNEFTAHSLNDGSMVALEKHSVMRWTGGQYDKPTATSEDPHWLEEYRPVYRPARTYWLEGQAKKAAGEFARFPGQHAQYTHSMAWGVLLSRDELRYVLPITESSARLRKDGSVDVSLPYSHALPLPLKLGSVLVSGKLPLLHDTQIHALEKYSAIDVVHAAAGRPQRKASPNRLVELARKFRLGGVAKPATQ